MNILTKHEILYLHEMLIDDIGGSHGIRDESLLDSAINAPFASFNGVEFFPSLLEKVSRLAYGLIENHPFIDGNKRIGLLAMQVVLYKNGIILLCSNEDLVELGQSIANGKYKQEQIVEWLKFYVTKSEFKI